MSKLDELYNKKKELLAQVDAADAELFAELKTKIEKVDLEINEAEKDEENQRKKAGIDAEMRGARMPNAQPNEVLFDSRKQAEEKQVEARKLAAEKKAMALRNGKSYEVETRAAVASSATALGTVASDTINPAFEQVGTIDKLVNETHLENAGAESYKKPFAKTYGEGVITSEGQEPSSTAEPDFGYAEINKVKIVAYAEVNEEVEKLPAANYIAECDKAVVGAWRRKVIAQIINGSGSDELVGIVNAPTKILQSTTRKTISTIDENTLDDIVFDYGGDENVEDDAVLILNKLTLKNFAKVKGADKRRAYDIVIKGNSGTINGTPFVCTSKLPTFTSVENGKPYMLYGKLKGYELTYFSNINVEKSSEYKFKEGIIALKASGFVGGSPAMFNGFLSIQKVAASNPTPSENEGE